MNRTRKRELRLEALESRHLLAAAPVITEFMAQNDGALEDGDGNSPDWIEIHNAGDASLDLAGYRLADSPDNLARWVFPSVELAPGGYSVVFASGQDVNNYVDTAGHLHTNFALRAEGEYLALVAPDGTVASQYGSQAADYPPQLSNVSYGMAQQETLVDATSDLTYWVPLGGQLGSQWTQPDFDAAAHGFVAATGPIGYETGTSARTSFDSLLVTDLPPRTYAVYTRTEFDPDDVSTISGLTLRLKYDDGFIAYLNGVEVARANAPDDTQWFSMAADGSRRDADALTSVDFDLSDHVGQLRAGTNVLAIHGLNHAADSDMLLAAELVAATNDDSSPRGYMIQPTPGAANVSDDEVFSGFVSPVQFSEKRGLHTAPLDVTLTTAATDAVIWYTTDGSVPTAATGTEYTGPIHVDSTTTLRAAAVKSDFIPSDVTTHTYVFLADVVRQPADPTGYPARWNGTGDSNIPGDYEMDPEVVDDPAYSEDIIDGLRSIPTMSLVMDPDDLFGSDNGIYVHSGQRGSQWKRGTSVEIIEPNGTSFQADSGVLIHGFSWRFHRNTPKHSFRLEFSEEYGPKKLDYKLFPDAPVDRFDSIVLRAQGGRAWAGQQNPSEAQYLRDTFARDTARDMGKVDGHSAFVHLYLNGLYWGLYHAVERPDAQMGEEYFGGSDEDYDALNRRTTTNEAIDGDLQIYNEMLRLADQGLSSPETYAEMQRYVDIDNLIDIFLIHQYTTNRDGPQEFQSNNQRAIGSRVGDPMFRFFVWDMEYSMWNATRNININVDVPGSASHVYTALRQNPEFRLRYADHAHQHLFNGGALTPAAAAARWETRADEIYTAVVAESARWGDAKRARPYTRDIEWQRERNRLLTQYFPARTDVLIQQLRDASLYPEIDAPVFSQHGGPIPREFQLTIGPAEAAGTVLFTLDGTDPRLPGGQVAPHAEIYTGQPIALGADMTVKSRILSGQQWSALNQAQFFVVGPDSPFNLRVTEVNYSPHPANPVAGLGEAAVDSNEFEFVELTNVGQQQIVLDGVQLARGIEFTFPPGSALGSGERTVVVKNAAAFQTRYGTGLNVAGPFQSGTLSDSGGRLEIRDAEGHLIQSLNYDDEGDWPARAGGLGSSLELIDPLGGYSDASSWRASSELGGSPGMAAKGPDDRIQITEVLAHSESPSGDMLELRNTTDAPIDITNWYVGNSSDGYFHRQVSSPTTVAEHGYAVLTGSELELDFNWWNGDEAWLIQADAAGRPQRFVDHAQFGSSGKGVSLGPGPDPHGTWLPLAEPTFGAENSGPRVGDVVITEIHYAPLDPDGDRRQFKADQFEFVEVYNRTEQVVDLTLWRLTGGVEMTFPSTAMLQPHQTMVIVPFSPDDNIKASVFRVTLGLGADGVLVGPYDGDLGDDGQLVRLEQLDLPPREEPTFLPYLYVDEVDYQVALPWPTDVAGTGNSLNRRAPDRFGNAGTSWEADSATPGMVDFVFRMPGDSNGDGYFDQLDIVQVLQGGKYLTGEPAVWTEGDWNEDGVFDQLDLVEALRGGTYL